MGVRYANLRVLLMGRNLECGPGSHGCHSVSECVWGRKREKKERGGCREACREERKRGQQKHVREPGHKEINTSLTN